MAPRSWRPDSSLADTIPGSEVQIETVVDPLADMQTEEELSALVDAPSAAFGQDRSNSFMDDNLSGETPTPRYATIHWIIASSIIFVPSWTTICLEKHQPSWLLQAQLFSSHYQWKIYTVKNTYFSKFIHVTLRLSTWTIYFLQTKLLAKTLFSCLCGIENLIMRERSFTLECKMALEFSLFHKSEWNMKSILVLNCCILCIDVIVQWSPSRVIPDDYIYSISMVDIYWIQGCQ